MTAQRPKITGDQIRAARALLNMTAQQLASAAKLARGTIQRAELGSDVTSENFERIIATLEKNIIFLPSNGEGPGVRLRKPRRR